VILRVPVIPRFSDLLRSAKINGFLQHITEVSVWPANKRNGKEMVPLLSPIHHSLQRPRKKRRFFRFVFVPRPSQSSAISPKRMLGHGHEATPNIYLQSAIQFQHIFPLLANLADSLSFLSWRVAEGPMSPPAYILSVALFSDKQGLSSGRHTERFIIQNWHRRHLRIPNGR
jgi:hypothetical protein